MSSTNLAEPGKLSMINYEATQDGGNYLGKEVDITSIAAHFYSVLLPVRCFPDEERDQETFLVLTRRSHQSRDFSHRFSTVSGVLFQSDQVLERFRERFLFRNFEM